MLSKWLEEMCFLLSRVYMDVRDEVLAIHETYSPKYRAHLREQRQLADSWRTVSEMSTSERLALIVQCETTKVPVLDYSTQPIERVTDALNMGVEAQVDTLPSLHAMRWLCEYKPFDPQP